jgi:hypothetical protein
MMDRNHVAPSTSLVDILDRVLDKGLVVAGDIRVSLANIELLTIRVRLLVCSIDKAQEIGLDWWRRDSFLSTAVPTEQSDEQAAALQERVVALEQQLAATNRRPRTPRRPRPVAAPADAASQPAASSQLEIGDGHGD